MPNVPIMDFAALRSSAAATGTLNIYGCKNSTFHGTTGSVADQGGTAGSAPWDLRSSCQLGTGDVTPHNQHFGNSTNYVATYLNAATDYVWYWDHDVTLNGAFNGTIPYSPGQAPGSEELSSFEEILSSIAPEISSILDMFRRTHGKRRQS